MATQFTRTPAPQGEESPAAYLIRLAECNGFRGSGVITQIAEAKSEYVATIGWDYSKLQPILGSLQLLPTTFGYRARGEYLRGRARLLEHSVSSRHLSADKARICPQCITELGYAPATWDLKAYIACHRHGTLMLKYCAGCGRRIRNNRPGLLECQCGYNFSGAPLVLAPAELVALSEVLHSRLTGDSSAILVARGIGWPISDLLACEVDVLCRVLVGMANLCSWMESGVRTPRKSTEVVKFLPKVGAVLTNWPYNFQLFCGEWHRHCMRRASAVRVFQRCFSWLFVRLHKNLKESGDQTIFLLREALVYSHWRWDSKPVAVREAALQALEGLPPKRYVSYSDAAQMLGKPEYTVMRWLKNGKLPGRAISTKEKRPCWVVDLQKLNCIKLSQHPGVEGRKAARLLGLPHKVYGCLRRDGDIPMEHLTEFRSTVAIEDLSAFETSILGKLTTTTSTHGMHPLADSLRAHAPPAVRAQLIRDLRDGRLAGYLRGGKCVENVFLREDPFAAILDRKQSSKISVRGACLRYDLRFYEARAMFLHLLGKKRAKRAPALDVHLIDDFLAEHMPLRSLASAEGVNTLRLVNALCQPGRKSCIMRLSSGCGPTNRRGTVSGWFLPRGKVRIARKAAVGLRKAA